MHKILLTLAAAFALLLSCTNSKPSSPANAAETTDTMAASTATADGKILPSDPCLSYIGRISFSNPNAPRMGFTGAQIYANFTGTSVKMLMKPGSGYFVAVVDSGNPITLLSEKDTLITIATGLKNATHKLAIYQCTEAADVNFPEFYGLQLDKGAQLVGKPQLPTRKIEFIGNSITCAKGAQDTTKAKDHDELGFENWYISYDAEVSRRLNAQCLVTARSGIGIYRNNGGRKDGDEFTMQYYFPRTILTPHSEMWDFSRFTPDLVCIGLGTNDTSQQYDVTLLYIGAKKFFQTVRQQYPTAKIVIMTGPMRSGKRLADQKSAIDRAFKELCDAGDKNLYRFDFAPDDGKLGYGTGHHPSVARHKQMADVLTPYLQKLMNW